MSDGVRGRERAVLILVEAVSNSGDFELLREPGGGLEVGCRTNHFYAYFSSYV